MALIIHSAVANDYCVISACIKEINYKFNLSGETYLRSCFVFQIVEALIYHWCLCLHGLLSSLIRILFCFRLVLCITRVYIK